MLQPGGIEMLFIHFGGFSLKFKSGHQVQSCLCGDQLVSCTYAEGGELIVDIQDVLDGVAHAADHPINHVHHAVRGHLVTVDDPGTVHGNDLHREDIYRTLQGTNWELKVCFFQKMCFVFL